MSGHGDNTDGLLATNNTEDNVWDATQSLAGLAGNCSSSAIRRSGYLCAHGTPMDEAVQYSPLRRDDWTNDLPDTEHVRFFKSSDWASGHLGPLSQWPTALRLHAHTLFADSRPSIIYWGPERVAIYNEAFIPLAAKAHPYLMAHTFEEGFPEIWSTISGLFLHGEMTKLAVDVNEMELFVERNGFVEEAYFTGNFNPIRGDDGRVGGFYNAVHETSTQVLTTRRVTMMNLAAQMPKNDISYGDHIMAALATNGRDVPMAMLYEFDEENMTDTANVRLVGTIGIPDDHELAVKEALLSSEAGLIPWLRSAQAEIVATAPGPNFDGILWKGFEEPSKTIHVVPLWGGKQLYGWLIIGANPRRAVDNAYMQYLSDLSRQLASTISSFVSEEKARKREYRLEQELAVSERQIRYLAKHASVGMQHVDVHGQTIWCNDQYYKITGHSRGPESQYSFSFRDVILETDRHLVDTNFQQLADGTITQLEVELRLKRMWQPPFGPAEPATMLAFATPFYDNGIVTSLMACVTDVSRLKFNEAWQARRAEEAQDAKRRQEEFVDIISHELRNPLGAIFQCADMISSSHDRLFATTVTPSPETIAKAFLDNAEDANTILLCARHQKRIVDDILTMSKLDFVGLSITPTGVQVSSLVDGVVKMFEAELASNHIITEVIQDPSLKSVSIDWILCDSSRLTQVLVNLLTNAIKFTRTEQNRRITITYGASAEDPAGVLGKDIHWAPFRSSITDLTSQWEQDRQLYLTFSIEDTGAGMTEDEIQRLFSRFEQGNRRTSIKYGGSGLGLYISRNLTAKHGGDIGVSSVPGKGSTFVFYVKVRHTEHPLMPIANPPPFTLELPEVEKEITERLEAISLLEVPLPRANPDIVLSEIHCLIVEDNIVNQQVLQKQLRSAGCIVTVANQGVEALAFLRTSSHWAASTGAGAQTARVRLDVVLMDVEMPIMNGLQCTREIRRLEATGEITRHVEVIGITANARPEQIELAMSAGMDTVITKPFMTRELLAKIREHLTAAAAA